MHKWKRKEVDTPTKRKKHVPAMRLRGIVTGTSIAHEAPVPTLEKVGL